MRDPDRIDRILAKIREVWAEQPDLRLCQLLGNVLPDGDNYFLEDDELERLVASHPRLVPPEA